MKYPIDLGRKHNLYSEPDATPIGAVREYYPSTRFEWGEDYEMPEEGTITLRYRVTRDVVEKVPKEKNCVDVDFLEIISVKGALGEKKDEYNEASKGLDKIKAELEGYSE